MNVSSSGQWTITPTATFTASIKMWGAAGGGRSGSAEYSGLTVYGGAGGYSYGTMSFVQGQSYVMTVGQGGYLTGSENGTRTIGGGGYGRRAGGHLNSIGGGLSGLFRTSYTQANSVLIAGGGGGSGHSIYNQSSLFSPAGGGSSGQNNSETSQGGGSGSQTAGGAPSVYNGALAGTGLLGGLGSTGGASFNGGISGGGGGYFGGGGGNAGHAGAGSGYVNTTYIWSGSTIVGNNQTPGNSSDVERGSSGGGRAGATGYDGRVIIS